MDFRRLYLFISDSLEALSWPASGDGRPRSEGEFLALWEMLRGIDTLNMPAIPPLPPPPPPLPQFEPSKNLRSLLRQREQLKRTLDAARKTPYVSKKQTSRSVSNRKKTRGLKELERRKQERRKQELEYELKILEGNIRRVWDREMGDYEARREAYNRTHLHPYQHTYLRPYLEAKTARERSVRERKEQLQSIEKVRKMLERAFAPKAVLSTKPKRLPWRVLPPGELSADAVRRHYDTLQRTNPNIRYERERITKALSLRPEQYYVGMDEFEGYMVLTFARTSKVLMECPIFGNAIYILRSDWKRLSRLSKRELLTHRSGQVTKIVHKGDWFRRVKLELGIR